MDFPHLCTVLRRAAWWILPLTALVIAGTYLYARQLPKVYVASTRILAPRPVEPGGPGDSLLGMAAVAVRSQAPGTPALWLAYLGSRSMAEAVTRAVQARPGLWAPAGMIQTAVERAEFLFSPRVTDATIDIRVTAPDPALAALVANLYPEQLDRMVRAGIQKEASRQRRFLEARLAQAVDALPRFRADPAPTKALIQALSIQVEQARIAEARDLPIVHVLDRATPPPWPVGPKVRQMVQFAGALAFVAACLVALGRDAARRRKSWPDSYSTQGIGV